MAEHSSKLSSPPSGTGGRDEPASSQDLHTTCPSCGLALAARTATLLPRFCPRCAARKRVLVELAAATRAASK